MSPWPWADPASHAMVLAAALAWDRWLGEPPARLHPVVWMGTAIGWLRRRAPRRPATALVYGGALALALPAAAASLGGLSSIPRVGPLLAVWLLTSSFAARGLVRAGQVVADALEDGDLAEGRAGLRSLCSRDPTTLDATEVAAAATESVAENTADSLVSPLFWYACGGLYGVLAYRCVNTLDAMIGYRGPTEWLGKASARLDDLLNLLPARLSALLLVASADSAAASRAGLRIMLRDHGRTESPNAGWPMSAVAGVVGVELAKPGHYVLGEGLGSCDPRALRRACELCARAMGIAGTGLVIALAGAAWI